jgi:hypothetical protein
VSFGVSESDRPGDFDLDREPLTVGQRLLWALDRLRGESGALNCPTVCWLEGPLDADDLRAALSRLLAAHPALRTTIVLGTKCWQRVEPPQEPPLLYRDLSGSALPGVLDCLQQELQTRIEPRLSPLRVSLWRAGSRRHLLVMNAHHIVTDYESSELILKDLAAALDGRPLPSQSHQPAWDFITFARSQRLQSAANGFARQQRYWFERLAGIAPVRTPLGPARADRGGSRGLVEAWLGVSTGEQLKAIAAKRGVSMFAVLLAMFFIMSWRETGDRDLAISSLFSGRTRPETSRTVGFLVNLLVLRVRVGARPRLEDFVDQSQRAIAGAMANADLPFHALSPPPVFRPNQRSRIDDLVFHASPEPLDRVYQTRALQVRALIPEVVGRFDLELAIRPSAGAFVVRLTFNEERMDEVRARAFLDAYLDTVRFVATTPTAPLERVT